jgi:hypothetical protein
MKWIKQKTFYKLFLLHKKQSLEDILIQFKDDLIGKDSYSELV